MNKAEIIDKIANDRVVEQMIENILHRHVAQEQDLKDLAQIVYLALLSQSEEAIVRMYSNNSLNFFIVGIIKRQAMSINSPYYMLIKRFGAITSPINEPK